ncbi:hypothetical protein HOD30_03825 [Candidatus Peregrinibacteria bacterium]|nr:hypothetical protein [Candidatus Peregrinibacteria bacterium]MBT4631704.1 hypothetical protein [Candidatus Peregrinibacteria bacterium]
MPLSEQTITEFEPRLQHLAEEIDRVDTNRRNQKLFKSTDGARDTNPSDIREAHKNYHNKQIPEGTERARFGNLLNIDAKSQATLQDALAYCTWITAQTLGIAKEHRQFMDISDLSTNDIFAALTVDAPEALRGTCLKLVRLIQSNKLWHVLVNSPIKQYYNTDPTYPPALDGALRAVVNAGKAPFQHHTSQNQNRRINPTGSIETRPVAKVHVTGIHTPIVDTQHVVHQQPTYLPGSKLARTGRTEFKEHLIVEDSLKGRLLYGTKLYVENRELHSSRLITVTGSMRACRLIDVTLLPGKGLDTKGLEIQNGELILEPGAQATFSSAFFLGTRISTTADSCPGVQFSGCDFSLATITDSALPIIAANSDASCIFSEAQMAIVDPEAEKFLSETAANEIISKFAPGEHGLRGIEDPIGIGRLPKMALATDHEAGRDDIATAPELKTANKRRAQRVYNGHRLVEDERILPALTSADAKHLPARVKVMAGLVETVREMGEYSPEKMYEFLISEGGRDLALIFGFGSTLDHLPQNLFHLPNQTVTVRNGDSRPRVDNVFPARNIKTGEFTQTYSYPDSDNRRDKDKYEPIYYTHIHQLRKALFDLCERLYHYGRYMSELTELGYSFPEADATAEIFVFEGVFNPNVVSIDRIENDVEIPVSNGSHITALTGPNTISGKTILMDAIARTVEQAQRGAPSPGKVTVPENGMFDHVLVMPNLRTKLGGETSGMAERAQTVLSEFLDRVKSLATDASSERKPRVMVCLDEIMMGVTRPDDAHVIECNFIDELMTLPDIDVNIMLVSPDGRVINALMRRFPERITIMAPDPDGDSTYSLHETDVPGESSASAILEEKGLGRFLVKTPWMFESKEA